MTFFSDLFSITLSGQELLDFGVSLFIALFIGFILYYTIKIYLKKIVKEAEGRTQKMVFDVIHKPLAGFIIITAVYIGLKSVSVFQKYDRLIDDLFFVALILITAQVLSRILNNIFSQWMKAKRGLKKAPKLITKLVSATVYIAGIAIIMVHFGVEMTPVIATLGVGGIAIGLALQGTLSNFFAGLNVLSDKPIRTGDFIEIRDSDSTTLTGFVEDLGWRSTRIKTLLDVIVVVPNNKLAESILINYSMPEEQLSIVIPCGVAYESDLEKVEKVTLETAREIQKTIKETARDFEPRFRYTAFGDSNITFNTILRCEDYPSHFAVKSAFIKLLKKRFDREKIEISWPISKVYFPQKNAVGMIPSKPAK